MTAVADVAERARIEGDLDATLFVEAAAGTGKTSSLVARVVRLVATGTVRLRDVAAITFTEKAAAELRDRLRRALSEAASPGSGRVEAEIERVEEARSELDDAAVCTLHAFAQRILAEHPLEAGLPPRFEVLDDIEAAAEFDASWDRFAGELLDGVGADTAETGDTADAADTPVAVALALGLRVDDLKALAASFRAHWDRLVGHEFPRPPLPPVDRDAVLSPLRRAVGRAGNGPAGGADEMGAHLAGATATLDRLAEAEDDLEFLLVLGESPTIASNRGRQGDWAPGALAEIKAALKAAQAAADALLGATCAALAGHLAERVRLFTLDEADRRRRAGRLEFHDLLVLACRLLRADEGVRRAVRGRWQRVLIDEFQDTDPLQIELAALLATPAPGALSAPWHELELDDGRLFFVGDPKQSIYRFRRADIALYQRVRQRFSAGRVPLHVNFRSAPAVVDWVNQAFGELMGDGVPGIQAPHVALAGFRRAAAPTVSTLGGVHPKSVPAADVREREAADVAAAVRRARDEGWAVHEGDHVRPSRLADVAVLLPTRRGLPELEHALAREGIPYRVESRSLLWGTQEVRDLLATLRAIDDPGDDVATVAALRSPGFACRDDELLEWRSGGGAWNPLAPRPDAIADDHSVARAMTALGALHRERHWEPLHGLVARVIRERRLLELQVAKRRPRDHWRRLRFVADRARAFQAAGGATLRGFVEWAERQAEEEALVNESVVPEADDDAVSILTIHAAKGLEFPVVVLAGLGSYPPPRRPPLLCGESGLEVELGRKHLGFRTPGYEARLEHEREAEMSEGIRLLYVAATRARDHLVVSMHHKEGTARAHAAALQRCDGLDALCVEADGLGPAEPVPTTAARAAERAAWLDRRQELLAGATSDRVVAATGVADAIDGGAGPAGAGPTSVEPPDDPPWKRGRAGTAFGRAVHAVLQSVDLATGDGVEALAAAQGAAEGIPDRVGDVERAVRAALSAPSVRAAAGGRFWREVYVGAEVGSTLLEGFVDLLVEGDDGLSVVDYKTDRLEGSGGDDGRALSDRYRLQGAAYAAALEAALGRPIARCTFVFVGDGRAVEVPVHDLAGAVAEVRTALA